jgi:4-hydroxy-3-methylbut-2-enyl diphosphate reductase
MPAPCGVLGPWRAQSVPADAKSRNMFFLDATCPLVSKVHVEAQRHFAEGHEIVLIGHRGHPEVVGTMGQLPRARSADRDRGRCDGVRAARPANARLRHPDDAVGRRHREIVAALKQRFPAINGPHKEDICYATTNRQEAIKAVAPRSMR